jgi:hypothetical protein
LWLRSIKRIVFSLFSQKKSCKVGLCLTSRESDGDGTGLGGNFEN